MKIAVVGSGISGLSAAYYLSKNHHVDLFEKEDHFGGHSHTIDLTFGTKKVSVDMDRFTSSQKYGYRFKSEAERRWFRRQHRNVEHDLIQKDKRGEYVFYCEAYTELPIEEKKQIESLIYQPERIYYHTWEKGDLLLANNMVTNHTRESTKYGKRHLWKLEGFKNEK